MSEAMTIATAPILLNGTGGVIDERWEFDLEESDTGLNGLKTIDFSKAKFVSGFCRGEDGQYVVGAGEVNLRRLRDRDYILYGYSVCVGLWKNHKKLGNGSVLERLFRGNGINWMSFFGDILLAPDTKERCVPVLWRLERNGEKVMWRIDAYWLSLTWSYKHATAVLPCQS